MTASCTLNWFSDGSGGLIYGYFRSYNGQPRGGIAGLNADGSLNGAYANVIALPGLSWLWCPPWRPKATARSSSAAHFNGVGGKYRGELCPAQPRWQSGHLFPSRVDGWVESVALQADGKILVAGNFGQCQGYARHGLARLNPDGSLDTAFNLRLGPGTTLDP